MAQHQSLTPRQRRFIDEYLLDLNASAAARRAGYSGRTAYSIGQENLKKPEIQAAIREAKQARSERVEVDQDYVVRRLKEEAELRGEGSSHSARVRALELLGKHVGLFPDRHEHSGPKGSPIPHEAKVTHDLLPSPEAIRAYVATALAHEEVGRGEKID